ncbi:hypothetical protein LIER_17000 [Lithospermum erythrorhizon]|uniref:Uncharacterized protein n=1 Tax=Lithospermum erythrorhizon TaxID=34254 RepID=A0AAV3Q9G4_LITER
MPALGAQMPKHAKGAPCPATIAHMAFQGPIYNPGFGRLHNPSWSTPRADRRTDIHRSAYDRDASPAPIRFPPDNFKHSLTLFSNIPKQPDSPTTPRGATRSGHNGSLTLSGALFQRTWAQSTTEDASLAYNSDDEAARFSSWAIPDSLAVTKRILTNDLQVSINAASSGFAPLRHCSPSFGSLQPVLGCIPKQPDSPTAPRGATGSGHNGALALSGAPFQGTWARSS